MLFSEYMTNTTAGNNFQLATALPNPERYFQILPAPNVHHAVVFPYFVEVILVNHKY